MKATIDNNEIRISLHDLADSMSPDDLKLLSQFAVFRETLLDAVTQTVTTGVAFEGDWWIGEMAQRLREKLVPLMPEVMVEYVRKLHTDLERAKAREQKLFNDFLDLCRHWPESVQQPERRDNE